MVWPDRIFWIWIYGLDLDLGQGGFSLRGNLDFGLSWVCGEEEDRGFGGFRLGLGWEVEVILGFEDGFGWGIYG